MCRRKNSKDLPGDRCLAVFLDDAFFVDDECEFAAELFGGFAAEDHAFEEDLEIIHDGANRFVELQ